MKPIIGLSMHTGDRKLEINNSYIKSIELAGGIPICIPHLLGKDIEAVLNKVDGLILIGGNDIDPMLFNEQPHPNLGSFSELRDTSDIALYQAAFKRNMPILAICRGIQIVNVACGGSLIQDIPSQVENAIGHRQASARYEKTHAVTITGEQFKKIMNESEIRTNSFHHQAVGRVGEGLIVAGTTTDGIIEALEHETHPYCISVQWHPEELAIVGDTAAQKLFESFIEATRQ